MVLMVIALPLAMVLVGLVVDGGLMYLAHRATTTAANLSAQAASHAVDEEYYRQTNLLRLDQARALGVAQQYAALNHGGDIAVTGIALEGRWVTVGVVTHYDTMFLRLAGINRVSLHARGRAYAAYGIDREGQ
jgi:uncharacterized membrane protein